MRLIENSVPLIAKLIVCTVVTAHELEQVRPENVGMSSNTLHCMERPIQDAIARGEIPGCVVLVARHGKIAWHKAYGLRILEPTAMKLTTDTLFDMASITKPVATATSIMQLAEQGDLDLDAPVADYLPEFAGKGKSAITIRHLLTHQGGLVPDNPLDDYLHGPEQAWLRICHLKPQTEVGTKFIYTDVGFITLGKLIEAISSQDLNDYTHARIFEPLGMLETGFLPDEVLRERAAPTEKRDEVLLQGIVHDPRSAAMGGIAGHAGLFSTSADLAVFAQMMMNRGSYAGRQVLKPQTVDQMTRATEIQGELRGLGWDKRSGYSTNRGDLLSDFAFGHGGFTGTVLWIDPKLDLFYIVLSSRLYPDGEGVVNPLAGRIGTIVAAAVDQGPGGAATKAKIEDKSVLTGVDVLERDGFAPLRGRRVGVITNHTGVNRQATSTVALLHAAPNVELVAWFSPEHGPQGTLDQARITDSIDHQTGVKVVSLYGATREPTATSLQGMDTLVFDIQDIGTRYYTYVATMGLAMRVAAKHGLRFVVLDRPNPIDGVHVQGPVPDMGRESFVCFHRIPIRHGMTVGELATMFRAEQALDLDLHVIRMEGWNRPDYFDQTGLWWIAPSPNMRNLNQALLYSGIGWLETTNLSVGRGTDTPFEILGAPWIDGQKFASELNRAELPGVEFVPVGFTPDSSKYAHEFCGGVQILITSRAELEPLSIGLTLAACLHRMYPGKWETASLLTLWGHARSLQCILEGGEPSEISATFENHTRDFIARRKPFLLYD